MKFRPLHFIATLLFAVLAGVAFAETTGTATMPGSVAVMGYSISYAMVLSWLLVPAAWMVTELLPVNDKAQPVIPFLLGAAAGALGHFAFGIKPEIAQAQFFAALAAGNMNGWVKVMLPWAVARLKKPTGISLGLFLCLCLTVPMLTACTPAQTLPTLARAAVPNCTGNTCQPLPAPRTY